MASDTGVDYKGSSLLNRHVLFVISGGIAAVESIKLLRELRRHSAKITIIMTKEAEKIISPLAISWAANEKILTDWDPEMKQLDNYDALLVAPATRNTIAKHIHGIMDSPVMMSLAAARGSKTPIVFIPSMHQDIFDDPVTEDLLLQIEKEGNYYLHSTKDEGKIKQPNSIQIVADFAHIINSRNPNRQVIAITLGANRAPIDAVRAIQNASSGRTGWIIAEYLYRMGHEVICIAGKTSANSSFILPTIIRAGAPNDMLEASLIVANKNPKPTCWIHAAAVLDYFTEPEIGKKASGGNKWEITLLPGPKHIAELSEITRNTVRIGFKLETNVSVDRLIKRSVDQIKKYGVNAVVANLLENLGDSSKPRAHIIREDGGHIIAQNEQEMCSLIEDIILGN